MTMTAAISFEPQSWVVVAAIAAATFVVLTGLQRRRRRESTTERTTIDGTSRTAGPLPQAAERWQVELHDFARETEARLDAKIAALQRLIVTADERIAQLESLGLDGAPPAKPAGASGPTSVGGPHFSTVEAALQGQARTAAIYAMSDAGNNAATIANRLGTPIAEVELVLSLRRTQAS